jgi:hypothetical protein
MPTAPVVGLMACLSDVSAVFRPDDLTELYVPVEAWDSSGEPWVVGPKALVQASTQAGFSGVTSTGQLRRHATKAGRPDVHRAPPQPPEPA